MATQQDTYAQYLTPNPDDNTEVIFNVPIYISKAALEAGAIEFVAAYKGWPIGGEIDAGAYLINWCKDDAIQCMTAFLQAKATADAIAASQASIETLLS